MQDKRKFLRFQIPIDLELIVAEKGKTLRGISHDFSRQGIGIIIRTDKSLRGSKVDLRLHFEPKKDPVVLLGKVAWVKVLKKQRKAGITITKMNPAKKSHILEKAYKAWRKEETKKHRKIQKTS